MSGETISQEDIAQIVDTMADPLWRICNIYHIQDKHNRVIPFRPNGPQMQILEAIYKHGRKRHLIIKSRQIGFSTLFAIIAFDKAYFESVQASIVDQTKPAATEKLRRKCRVAWEHLPVDIRETPKADSGSELSFESGGSISAGMRARGGTNQVLHISEWGPIAHDDPKRSEEIKTGALPSVPPDGLCFIETTFKGGKGGHLWEQVKRAQSVPDHLKTDKDFWFWFFPWYRDNSCAMAGPIEAVPPDVARYLDEKEKEIGVTFTTAQRVWYAVTKAEQGIFMGREYPTTPDEAFRAPIEGAIYSDILSNLRSKGRVVPFEWDRAYPVFASWDLGWSDNCSVWFWQLVGPEIHIIWHCRKSEHTPQMMVDVLMKSGIPVSGHFLPHDARGTSKIAGLNYQRALQQLGLQNVQVVQRTTSIWIGINATRDLLKRAWIHAQACDEGISALEAYHTKQETAGGVISHEPVHDWSSHDADALRTAGEAIAAGIVKVGSAKMQRAMNADDRAAIASYNSNRPRPGRGDRALSGFSFR